MDDRVRVREWLADAVGREVLVSRRREHGLDALRDEGRVLSDSTVRLADGRDLPLVPDAPEEEVQIHKADPAILSLTYEHDVLGRIGYAVVRATANS